MKKQDLQAVLVDQKELFLQKTGLIERDIPLDSFLRTSQVVVITGVRRCGKSSLMCLIREALKLNDSEFCYCNFDDERIVPYPRLLSDIHALHLEMYRTEPVFFLDEVQLVPGWEKFVNRMYEQGLKVFVTGSNAQLLSSELATTLTGRTKILELFPFSFFEYLRYFNKKYSLDQLSVAQRSSLKSDLTKYLSNGGFPLVVKENDVDLLNGWFQDILYRDIVARYNLTSIAELKQTAIYLITNMGKLFSYSTLQKVSGLKSSSSVKDFLGYFEASYLFYYVRKFDYSVKKQILNSRKLYVIDNGIHIRLGVNFSENKGRLLENAVFVELLRRKKEVFYYNGKNECDFLIVENLEVKEAIQVTYEINEHNVERELKGLKEAAKEHQITRLTLIVFEDLKYQVDKDINVITLYDWLLKNES